MRLITIPMSHFCEKVRWGLDYAGLPYVEDAHLQIFHYRAAKPYNDAGMVPVLVTNSGAISDSTQILRFIDQHLPESAKLYPAGQSQEIAALEDYFDEQFGVETRRWAYFNYRALPPRAIMRTAGQGAPRWQRALARPLLPLVFRFINHRLQVSRETVERGWRTISTTFDFVAAQLNDGRAYRAAGRFTAADLTFAALAAPVLLPTEYGVRLPSPEEVPEPARTTVMQLRDHPAGQFALRLFREHRVSRFTN